jgi:hypothetical protein
MDLSIKVSNENKSVFSRDPRDLSFSGEFDMFKIKQEAFAQNGETITRDHSLNYFPFFLAYNYASVFSLADARQAGTFTDSSITNWSFMTKAYIFIAHNPGVV